MSGVVKGIKKVFKSVVDVVKKIWKPLLIAAAVYFTAGLALSAFPATASFAASMPGFAGGGILGTGVGAGATAGTGIFSTAAAKMGLGALGASGGLAGGAMAAGTSASALSAAGFSTAAIAEGASAVVGSTLAAGDAIIGAGAAGAAGGAAGTAGSVAATAPAVGGATTSPSLAMGGIGTGAGTGTAAAGMSLGEKMLLASSGVQALGVLMGPDPEESRRWAGAFYGVTYKGGGAGPISGPGKEPTAPQPGDAGPDKMQPSSAYASAQKDSAKPLESPTLFEQKTKAKTAAPAGDGLLFGQPNQKVRYV